MTIARKSAVLCAVLLVVNIARAQDLVNVQLILPQYNQLYAAELDIQNVNSPGILFTVLLTPTPAVTSSINVRLQVSVDVTLSGQSPMNIATATTTPIALTAGQTRTVTNVDISGSNPAIPLENWSFNAANFNAIKNIALATGKMPAGVYTVNVSILVPNSSPVSQTGQIVVTNPSRTDLVLPMNQTTISSPFPRFQWAASTDSVVLRVFQQQYPQQNPEEVVSANGSSYEMLDQGVVGSYFQYPPSGPGVRPLQNGMTYFWYIEIPVSSTEGQGLRSDIWSFTVGTTSDTSSIASHGPNDAATQALINLLTGTQYQGTLSQVKILTGNATYDGKSLGTGALIDTLRNIRKSQITNVTIH
ncbi:MAG: hypothetical protein M1339_07420 [Bacteroidetes bacterium]|nr:hypothetical protein [Bacteroidota bacterium]